VRDSLAGWYAQAIQDARIVPVGDPQLDLADLPAEGDGLRFSIEIGVLPRAQLGDYEGLEVPRRQPTVAEEQIAQEIDAVRERLAKLQTAERAAAVGDFLVIDYVGSLAEAAEGEQAAQGGSEASDRLVPFAGGEGRDQLIELGGGNLIPGFEEALVGARAGEERTVKLTFPSEYPNEELAGRPASFVVTVKEVKLKQLPDVDDDLAIDVGFDDVDELREDIRARLLEADQARVDSEFREAALDAAVARATVPVTAQLVESRAREMWESMLHSLSHRGISREAYLQIAGREEQQILADMQADAEQALRREAVLTAIVAAERIEPSEEQVLEALQPTAEREGLEPDKLLQDLRANGRLQELREDLAARMAVELIAERAEPIGVEQAQARDALWTPGKDAERQPAVAGAPAAAPAKIWTPTGEGSSS
jgi:trigger factor